MKKGSEEISCKRSVYEAMTGDPKTVERKASMKR